MRSLHEAPSKHSEASAVGRAVAWAVAIALAAWSADLAAAALWSDGDRWARSLLASNLAGLAVLFAAIRFGARTSIGETLALHAVPVATLVRWTFVLVVFSISTELLLQAVGLPADANALAGAYASSPSSPWLWIAVTLSAPLFEETFFRGYLFRLFERTRLQATGATMATTLLWAASHQGLSTGAWLFVLASGLLLGSARARTGSLLPSLYLHSLNNALLMLQTIVWQ